MMKNSLDFDFKIGDRVNGLSKELRQILCYGVYNAIRI